MYKAPGQSQLSKYGTGALGPNDPTRTDELTRDDRPNDTTRTNALTRGDTERPLERTHMGANDKWPA